MDLKIDDTSFRATPGKNILKKINKEFGGDKTRVSKYVQLFQDTFVLTLDKETVVDVNKNNNFIFSNKNFPHIKYQHRSNMRAANSIAKTLINECSKIFGNGENSLFRIVISKSLNKGVGFRELEQAAQKISNPKSREYYIENVKIAKRLKKEYPKTKFSSEEFDYMQNKMLQEEAETPGTKLYELIKKIESSSIEFSFN